MAGLIQQKMGDASVAEEEQGQMPADSAAAEAPMQADMQGKDPMAGGEDEVPDEDDPAFQTALTYAYEALYKNEAAKDIAKQLKASAQDVAGGMANVAFEVTSIVDERTDGNVPENLLGLLAMAILSEVADIAEAAGLDPTPEDVAAAFKDMLLRYLGENGVDTSQLQQAMDQVDPSVFKNAAAEV